MAYPILAPNSTWYKSTQSRSTITEINIVDFYSGGTADETWNADADNSGSIKCYRTGTVLTIAGNGSGKIAMNADSLRMFSHSSDMFTSLTTLSGLALLDASNVTTLERAFDRCTKVTALDISGWDVSKVESMDRTFQCCAALDSLDLSGWDVSSCKTFRCMFQGNASVGDTAIVSIGDVSNWNTSSVEDMAYMFTRCTKLKSLDLSGWDVSNVTSMQQMFVSCLTLTSIGDTSGWVASKCQSVNWMFGDCEELRSLELTKFITNACTDMTRMFQNCTNLEQVSCAEWDTSHVTSFDRLFDKCISLKTIDLSNWDVSSVTTFRMMFAGYDYGNPAMSIADLDFSKWKTSSCTHMGSMFYGCKKLGTIDISNWDVSKVENFDHFMAHSGITLAGDGVARWVTSAAKTMDAMLYSCRNEVLDVSNFDTSNVLTFNQMFESCTKLKKIIGLENFVTSASLDFSEMFWNCVSLEELNLSAFDTRNATDGADRYGRNGEKTTTMVRFFDDEINSLKRVVLGKNFSFNGDGTTTTNAAVLPTPSGGMWYNASGEGFAPADVPNYAGATYFAAKKLVNDEVIMRRGTITRIADAIRRVVGDGQEYTPSEMADRLCAIAAAADANREYGVEWDYSQDGTTLTRLGDAALFANPAPAKTYDTVGTSQFDNIMPWAGMKRYNIVDNNVISEDDEGFRTDVDTMVYIPEFYFKAEKDEVNHKWRWYVRSTPADGFARHPGSGRYIGRYHTSEKYMSVSNVMPIGNITFPTARANSHAKGERWWMMDAATWGAVQLLYLVEFADFDAQKTLGVGQNTSATVNTGATDTARYHTQCINGTASNQYRWIENPFTNTVTMCDGIMLDAEYKLHIGTDNNVFNGTAGVLGDSGVTVPVFSGFKYVGGFGYSEKFPWAFLPDTFVDSAENVPDAWYLSSSARLNGMTVGGSIGVNDRFGMWYADASVRETASGVRQGTRLIYVP